MDRRSESITPTASGQDYPSGQASKNGLFVTPEQHEDDQPATPSARLHRSGYILFLVLLYIFLALFSWIVICYLSFRPITTDRYGLWLWDRWNNEYPWARFDNMHSLYTQNERWYHAARVIQSIVGVLTIPLTSAVCSCAAVVFIQRRQARGRLRIRQVITLADKGWTDLRTYAKTVLFFAADGEQRRYGSSFLLLAMFATVLGSVIWPLQAIFLSTKTIKTPTWPTEVRFLLDIPDQWKRFDLQPDYEDKNRIVIMTRNALTTATTTQQQAQLWRGAGVYSGTLSKSRRKYYGDGGVTFGNMSDLPDPFLAQLSADYNTGLVRQFIPRINSTAQYRAISEEEFPKGCDKISGAFFVDYRNTTDIAGLAYTWGLQACMPADVTRSPWKSTRDRQDFSEELYLKVTLIRYQATVFDHQDTSFYKITLNTTAGYFELPNYMNNGTAGPLLDKDPNNLCGNDCETEGAKNI